MSKKPKLSKKLRYDSDARVHQEQVRQALICGSTWGLIYLLAWLKDRAPYRNYKVPTDIEYFEFTVKGVIRREMMTQDKYQRWRRMFGSTTEMSKPSAWRSRALIKVFPNLQEIRSYIKADPLITWNRSVEAFGDEFPVDKWYILFQIQDIWLADEGFHWSDLLESYLKNDSQFLSFAGRYEILPTVDGENGGRNA
jgi:hypothetical protein